MATPDEVKKALMAIMPLFANYRPPATAAEVQAFTAAWHRQVGHLEIGLLHAALAEAAGKTGFFPTPKEVLDSVAGLTVAPSVSGAEAWGKVTEARQQHNSVHPPGSLDRVYGMPIEPSPDRPGFWVIPMAVWDFADPITAEAVRAIGWETICDAEDDTVKWQFIKAYDTIYKRQQDAARELPIVADVRRQVEAARDPAALLAGVAQRLSANRDKP